MGRTARRFWWIRPRTAGRRSDVEAWLSGHHCGHGGRGRRDMSRIGALVEGRPLASKFLGLLDEVWMVLDEPRAEVAGTEIGILEDCAVIADRGRRTDQDKL